jgi:geranylgeranyl pyrophosphate synthase
VQENRFVGQVNGIRRKISEALEELVAGLGEPEILPQIRYALTSNGKRLRPVMVMLSGACIDPDRDLMDLALAFELLHTATLVHDDIIDMDEVRRDQPSVHNKWTLDDAILTGDALIALSVRLASGFGPEVIRKVADAALELCEGEHMDITPPPNLSEKRYIEIISRKSAALFRSAAECGALAAGADPRKAGALACYGHNFGMAYQLRDDLRDHDPAATSIPLREMLGEYCKAARDCLRSLPESAGRADLLKMADLLASSGGG